MGPRITEPKTDGQLYDLLRKVFGIGDYDEGDLTPWHKARGVEIAKLRAIRTKRGLSYADFTLLTSYCSRRGVRIHKAWDLLEHLPAALRERAATRTTPLDRDIADAVEWERSHFGESEWVDRLLRASGPGRAWALQAWQEDRDKEQV